jgi:hypothetical protein
MRTKVLALIAGVVFVVGLMTLAPIALGLISWVTAGPAGPSPAEVCARLNGELQLGVPDCEAWLEGELRFKGDMDDEMLLCLMEGRNYAELKPCESMEHLRTWKPSK